MSAVANIRNKAKNFANKIMDSNCYLIIVYIVSIIFLVILTYSIYFRREMTKKDSSLRKMEKNKEKVEDDLKLSSVTALTNSDYNKKTTEHSLSYGLIDYYVFGSVNSCCQGDVINGYVSIEALKNVISYGVRLLDFELYFKDNKVVVAAGRNNVYMKDTYNHLEIGTVLAEIKKLALRGGAGNLNQSDPLILNFRIVSNNPNVYHILEKKIMKHLADYLADRRFGKEGKIQDKDIFTTDFKKLKNKVLIFVDDPNKNYEQNPNFYELVNASTHGTGNRSGSLSLFTDYQIKNENSPEKYRNDAHHKFIITKPDVMEDINSSYIIHHGNGCQGVMMNFGGNYFDDNMEAYIRKFSQATKAFVLKPTHLLRPRTVAKMPEKQDPKLNPASAPVQYQMGAIKMEVKGQNNESVGMPYGGRGGN